MLVTRLTTHFMLHQTIDLPAGSYLLIPLIWKDFFQRPGGCHNSLSLTKNSHTPPHSISPKVWKHVRADISFLATVPNSWSFIFAWRITKQSNVFLPSSNKTDLQSKLGETAIIRWTDGRFVVNLDKSGMRGEERKGKQMRGIRADGAVVAGVTKRYQDCIPEYLSA